VVSQAVRIPLIGGTCSESLDRGGRVGVPHELVRSSKELYADYRFDEVVAATAVDAIISGTPGSDAGLRLLFYAVFDWSVTIRLEHAADIGSLRITCSPALDGVMTIEQAGLDPAWQPITAGCATVHGIRHGWTSVVLNSHRSRLPKVRTARTLL